VNLRSNVSKRSISYAAPQKKKWLWTRDVAERYNCSPRTVKRWKKAGKLPPPTKMPNGRDAWTNAQIEEHERSLVGGEAE
jgi:uncharacterized protein YjcR